MVSCLFAFCASVGDIFLLVRRLSPRLRAVLRTATFMSPATCTLSVSRRSSVATAGAVCSARLARSAARANRRRITATSIARCRSRASAAFVRRRPKRSRRHQATRATRATRRSCAYTGAVSTINPTRCGVWRRIQCRSARATHSRHHDCSACWCCHLYYYQLYKILCPEPTTYRAHNCFSLFYCVSLLLAWSSSSWLSSWLSSCSVCACNRRATRPDDGSCACHTAAGDGSLGGVRPCRGERGERARIAMLAVDALRVLSGLLRLLSELRAPSSCRPLLALSDTKCCRGDVRGSLGNFLRAKNC